jgi:hypothetical protein
MCWVALIPVAIAAVSAYQNSQAQKNQGEYQAKVAKNNEIVANMQAVDAKERGDQAAAGIRRKYAALQGTQAATLAARGLDISEGSANAILTDTDFFGDFDQRTARSNAAREAWGFKVRAGNFAGDAAAYQAGADGQNPVLSGVLAGTASYFGNKQPSSGGGAGSGSALTSSGAVSSYWYGKPSANTSYSGSPSISNYG